MIYSILFFILGLVLLIKSAGWLITGASALASRLKISPIIVGLTIVSFGTSLPELTVNIIAMAQGNTGIALGNIIGSNVTNILLILGVSSIIFPIIVKKRTAHKEIPFAIFAGLLVLILGIDGFSLADGLIMLVFFVTFIIYTFRSSKDIKLTVLERLSNPNISLLKSTLLILVGFIGLAIGGKLLIDGVVYIARFFSVSETFIGLTAVAIGTSLPQLATAIAASMKKESDMIIGNIIGSNIFNTLFILGISILIKPIEIGTNIFLDLYFSLGIALILFLFLYIGQRHTIKRWQGWFFLVCFVGFLFIITI